MRKILALFLFLILTSVASAQTTTVSGSATDANSQVFANGTYSITFNLNGQVGITPPTPASFSGSLNASGAFSGVVVASNTGSLLNTQWRFQFCPQATSPCFTQSVAVSGASQAVNVTAPAIIVNANAVTLVQAYSDSELSGASVGSTYYNTTSNNVRMCNTLPCGGGNWGSPLPLTSQVPITFSATPTFPYTSGSFETIFSITLTGNVTSATISGGVASSDICFIITQDSTGGRTFAAPTNVLNWAPINLGVNSVSSSCYNNTDGTHWQNLDLTPGSTLVNPAPNGVATFNVQNPVYGASGTTRKITGSYSFTNPGTTGSHVVTVNSGGGFLATDVNSQLDCYSTTFNLEAINSSLVTAFTSSTSITVSGTASNSTGSAAQVCAVGGKDDTAAIVAAQTALVASPNGGSLYFPCGGYLITSHLSATLASSGFPANSQVIGDGSSCVTLFIPGDFAWVTTSYPLFNVSVNATVGAGAKVKGITVDGMSQNNSIGSVPAMLQGGQFEDIQLINITTVNACIQGSTDNVSTMINMRSTGALCGGLGYPMTLTAHGSSLINPQIKNNGFSSAEPDISIIGGFIFGPVGLTSQGANNTAVQINGTHINGPLNIASHGGAFISAANIGPCNGQAGSCAGTENSNGISIDATSNVYITNSNLSAGGSGKAAISMATGSVATIGPGVSLTVTNSATPFSGQGTIIADGHSVAGACTGVATAASTLGLFGTGPNETLTTCTSTTIGSGIVMQRAGTLMGLIANSTAAGVNASSGVVTVLKNGSATTITCTFGTTTACNDGTHTVAFVSGDLISLQFTTQIAETLAGVKVSVIWL